MKLFTVHDAKAEYYLAPFMQRNKGEAIRNISRAVQDENSTFHVDPSSFTLVELAEYDQDKGVITPHPTPVIIGNLNELQ